MTGRPAGAATTMPMAANTTMPPAGTGPWPGCWAHTLREFVSMGKYLLLGGLAAAVLKGLPALEHHGPSSNRACTMAVALMMTLAVLLSVCSEADAFVAVSFASFPVGAPTRLRGAGPHGGPEAHRHVFRRLSPTDRHDPGDRPPHSGLCALPGGPCLAYLTHCADLARCSSPW